MYVVVSWKPIPPLKACQYGSQTLYGTDHSRVARLKTWYVPAGVAYPLMPVRITVGPHTTAPPRTAQAVCWVRSTQIVSAGPGTAHLACSAAVPLVAIR